ncbi:DUF3077 domain-containing protein [Pseudomonas sp. LS1212]|uniref:DUF3077 domain-containing protein n=1 Tax=Pseudomonas sp. LS1212 TaxID=2972478 RepID=UPI00215BF6DA|nr:DUF3077 domain-containing protein [Pseudomonas sp. LS1212]UVJ45487.1 DUF3077 domain-containing protein [Pseudomonas sp. LS1212]
MNKIVPDPPSYLLSKTASTAFGSCDAGHDPLFAVREGIDLEDALVHISLLLAGVCDTAQQACEHPAGHERKGLLWANLHSAEAAKGLVDALLDGIENQAVKRATEPAHANL